MKIVLYLTLLFSLIACQKDATINDAPNKEPSAEKTPAKKALSPGEKAKAMVKNGALLIDVRSAGEFSSGSIPGAVNIPVRDLSGRLAELDKTKEVVVFCASGARSASAKAFLEKEGFKTVFNMGGKRAWK